MSIPVTTRLRYVSAKDPAQIPLFLQKLGFRVQVYGAPVWDGKRWFLWFVPPDVVGLEVKSVNL